MIIKKLTIDGLRGFSEETNINFAVPDKETPGSGLTVFVGPNNSGKSTIIEAIHLLTTNNDLIPISARNIKKEGQIKIQIEDCNHNTRAIESTKNKGAFVQKKLNNEEVENWINNMNTYILSSKRGFSSTFSAHTYQDRDSYKGNVSNEDYRNEQNTNYNFGGRLLSVCKNRKLFDECLSKVLHPLPEWTIEATTNNNLYLEFSFNEARHSSNGAGDGYINIFNIVDALYDSKEDNVIVIDEPEISLHPDLQRRLFKLLIEYSKDKQIIVSTHSTYFVDWEVFSKKSKIMRVKKENDTIRVYELSEKSKEGINKILNDYQKPHILSLTANEIFFLQDNVILTEGQDDVLCYRELFKKYDFTTPASFFGWGAGGAQKIKFILNILEDLGYKNVFTILDGDQKESIETLNKEYENYSFFAIAANDVRNKKRDKDVDKLIKKIRKIELEQTKKDEIQSIIEEIFPNKIGLVKNMKDFEINKEYEESFQELLRNVKEYFESEHTQELQQEIILEENEELEEKLKAQKLLDDWLIKNKLYEYSHKKYKYLEFNGGGSGGLLSLKAIGNGKFYAIIQQSDAVSDNQSIELNFHVIIDTNKKRVKLKKKQVLSNTLPVSNFEKIIEKIFN